MTQRRKYYSQRCCQSACKKPLESSVYKGYQLTSIPSLAILTLTSHPQSRVNSILCILYRSTCKELVHCWQQILKQFPPLSYTKSKTSNKILYLDMLFLPVFPFVCRKYVSIHWHLKVLRIAYNLRFF